MCERNPALGGDFPGMASVAVAAPGMGTGKVSEVAGVLVAPAASGYPAQPSAVRDRAYRRLMGGKQ